ncbi:MAG: hypothetical protein KGV44_02605, partial [Flavobacteriaceae bacterium]|nr:hypothetical protein [Flavobacteriaceae bacterium]
KNRILMLDILANNHWKQPIYFTGGADADEEYIWLKDYLQLDGIAYKLVPIKTKNKGFMDMGRIDTDKLYERVKKWDWKALSGNNVYLDPETRKNSITYRNTLERLAKALIAEKKFHKAEEVIDMATVKIPVSKFGHYSLILPFVELYYQIGKKEKGRKLYEELREIFQEYLVYYSQFNVNNIDLVFPSIERNLYSYDELFKKIAKYEDKDYINQEKRTYIDYIKLYDFLMADEPTQPKQQ